MCLDFAYIGAVVNIYMYIYTESDKFVCSYLAIFFVSILSKYTMSQKTRTFSSNNNNNKWSN